MELIRKIKADDCEVILSICKSSTHEDIHLLCIKYKNYSDCFNINWLEYDDVKVDWLAQIIGYLIKSSYDKGVETIKLNFDEKLKGFKELLK